MLPLAGQEIAYLIGENPYGTTAHFAQGLASACARHGAHTRVLWIGEGHFAEACEALRASPPTLTCSFSVIRSPVPLSQLWGVPHLTLLVDPAVYALDMTLDPGGWIACVDAQEVAFLQASGYPRAFFLPHAADPKWYHPPDTLRPYPFVFLGSCLDYQAYEEHWESRYSPEERALLHTVCEQVLATDLSLGECLGQHPLSSAQFLLYHAEADRYLRGKERVALLRTLPPQELFIWGEGPWEKYLSQAHRSPALPFAQALERMQQAQVVVHCCPRFKQGGHERVFYAQMCGACVVAGATPFIRSQYTPQEIYTYSLAHPTNPMDGVGREARLQRAYAGQAKTLAAHTWDQRALVLAQQLPQIQASF